MSGRTLILNRIKQASKALALVTSALALVITSLGCSDQKFSLESESQEYGQKVTYNTDVDVLWVIDTSSSMDQHQERLASQVGSFIDTLNQTGLTYQIGVTTMDFGAQGAKGRFLAKAGTPSILKANTPQLATVLGERLRIGGNGSPVERGLEAMKAALQGSSVSTSPNFGFLRPNALLVVIFLTNEEDESTPADYAGFLDQVRPPLASGERSWLAHFMGVTSDDPNCKTAEWNYSSVGTKYIGLAQESGGVVESICDADLRRSLTNVKARILEVMTEYALGREPIVDSIRVAVNGVSIKNDEVNGWTYFSDRNSIRFHGTAVPRPNSRIKVDFDPAGLK